MKPDFKTKVDSTVVLARLVAIGQQIADEGQTISLLSRTDANAANEQAHALHLAVSRELAQVRVDLGDMAHRQSEAAKAEIKLAEPADAVDLGGELFTEIEPPTVTAKGVDKPIPQADRVGGG